MGKRDRKARAIAIARTVETARYNLLTLPVTAAFVFAAVVALLA